MQRFGWYSFDISSILPSGWSKKLISIGLGNSDVVLVEPTSVTSREAGDIGTLETVTVPGDRLYELAPWLVELYRGLFRDLGQQLVKEPLACAESDLYAVVLNVQYGEVMRYECHVDSNPLQGLLYVTTHTPGDGGELVVGNVANAKSVEEVDADCSIIYPVAGHLLFFDGREHPHYVRSLKASDAVRVVVAMNFYTPSSPESRRPRDLNSHLFGRSLGS
ncbi:2OG-Fe(II) oxygenase [Amycolatopsis sp. NPDC024027]|uniref:2OG-Fe(II) oxygenase n=1 Tax=Amycolatopsis sp. NPDC024027 TaxID=3154327 RepID=UPI003404C3B0